MSKKIQRYNYDGFYPPEPSDDGRFCLEEEVTKLEERIKELENGSTKALSELSGLVCDPWKAADILRKSLKGEE